MNCLTGNCNKCSFANKDSDGNYQFQEFTTGTSPLSSDEGALWSKRCIICKTGYHLNTDGVSCQACSIANCDRCFFTDDPYDETDDSIFSTFPNVHFEDWISKINYFDPLQAPISPVLRCYQCKPGFVLSID